MLQVKFHPINELRAYQISWEGCTSKTCCFQKLENSQENLQEGVSYANDWPNQIKLRYCYIMSNYLRCTLNLKETMSFLIFLHFHSKAHNFQEYNLPCKSSPHWTLIFFLNYSKNQSCPQKMYNSPCSKLVSNFCIFLPNLLKNADIISI